MIYNLIKSVPDALTAFDANDDAGCIAALNALTTTVQNTRKQSMRDTILALGQADYDTLAGTLANSTQTARDGHALLIADGLNYADPLTQAVLEALRPVLGDDLTDRAKQMGIRMTSPAQQSLGRDATQADIDTARQEKLTEWLMQSAATIANEQIATGQITTQTAVAEALADMEEGEGV